MSCAGCEERIRRSVEGLDGVVACVAEQASSRVTVSFVPERVDGARIAGAIAAAGYEVEEAGSAAAPADRARRIGGFTPLGFAAVAVVLAGALLGLRAAGLFALIPDVRSGLGSGLLFVVGLMTSFHCVAMCGAIGLSQSLGGVSGAGAARLVPGLAYNAGRLLAYTAVGAIVGGVGAVLSFTPLVRALITGVAGASMLLMGAAMLGFAPWLRRLLPRVPAPLRRIAGRAGGSGPFVVGLLNGLMPCGPLQSMQLYALGTGSAAAGALAMFLFGLGTVPLMLGFGTIANLMPRRAQARVMGVGALLVAFLGIGMVARGLNLGGAPAVFARTTAPAAAPARPRPAGGPAVATIRDGVQYVETTLQPSRYEPIVVQAGVPLRWTVTATAAAITGCNSPMTVPAWGIQKRLVPGANLIEFVPRAVGDVRYTCWMGMITSVIRVVPSLADVGSAAGGR